MSVAIHNIDIKKPKTNEEISFIQKLFNDKLSPKIKEMANKYRLQQLPKTKFVGGSMKTMKQGKHISIKYGQLKPECEHLCPDMEGKGLFDFIKSKAKDLYSGLKSGVSKVFSTRLDDYNNTTKETLRKYGDMNIDNLMIYRTPVNSMIDKALNIFSFGKFAEMKKKYGFDEFFHLALVAQVKGKNVIIEKNEVINVSTSYNTNDRTETMKVEMKRKPLTINQLLNATREKQTPDDYFSYDAFNNNCQMFIRALLRNVDLYTKDIDGFLFQNVENLIKEMPTLAKVAKTATDIGAWFNKITGQGGYVDMFGKYYPDTAGYYFNRNKQQPILMGNGCKYCSIMKGLGDLNRLYNGSGQATGFIRVLMANKDKKGDRRRNRRGQLLPNFDLDADYKASVDVIKTNKKATKHKKYFKDLSVLEDKEQMREKGYNPARSYYDINHDVRDGYDIRGQQNREAGARWRARNREAERERQKKKREERRQRVGSGKKVIPAVVENILMSIKPKKEAV